MLEDEIKKKSDREIEWLGLRRREPSSKRGARPNQFYPIFANHDTGMIDSIGEVVKLGVDRNTILAPDNCVAIWPINSRGGETLWGLTPDILRENWKKGYVRIKKWNKKKQTGTVYYLPSGTITDIEDEKATITGYNTDGSIIASYSNIGSVPPKRVWNMKSHNAETYGTKLLSQLVGKERFNFPKSIYAVHDAIQFFVADNPNALVVDFFAGSGTTLHAVNLLNAEDSGHRRCIMVTNNEVSVDEAETLKVRGFHPGDPEWEELGIARYVTWPRTINSIKGHDVSGHPLKGNYLSSDIPMADGFKANAIYLKLSFLNKTDVALGRQFKEMLPTLWMKAGAYGPCPLLEDDDIPDMLVLQKNRFAVLNSNAHYAAFEAKVNATPKIDTVYIVTDSEAGYREMIAGLHAAHTYQLYRDYLDNFRINSGR